MSSEALAANVVRAQSYGHAIMRRYDVCSQARWNSSVFSCLQKAVTVDESRTVMGSEFRVVGLLDAELLCP